MQANLTIAIDSVCDCVLCVCKSTLVARGECRPRWLAQPTNQPVVWNLVSRAICCLCSHACDANVQPQLNLQRKRLASTVVIRCVNNGAGAAGAAGHATCTTISYLAVLPTG